VGRPLRSNVRRVLVVALGLLVAGLVLFYQLDPDARLKGWVRGDPWYRGRPATAWRADLARGDENARALAAQELRSPDALPVLEALLRGDGPAEPRWRAADVLGQLGPPARAAAPALVAALDDPDPHVRAVAVRSLGRLAPDVPGAVPALVGLFPDLGAIRAVAEFRAAGAEAVPRLTELLNHPDPAVRRNAARTLGRIGEAARPSAPALAARLTDDDPAVREYAAKALGGIGPSAAAAVPELVKLLDDPEPQVRQGAVVALGDMREAAKEVLPRLRALKDDPDPAVRSAAELAEQRIERQGNPGREPKRD
jgi:HEAT repeat protein